MPVGNDEEAPLGDFIEDTNNTAPIEAAMQSGLRDVVRDTRANHQVEVRAGLRAQESQDLLTAFFADRR